ncbi:hypothetical protein, partial [Paraburkholderia humisilvae]|uniref:hypothetical protein n=1 Tax=Paraburkholderia humisilvae TaxID=627669 RepID=UPI0035F01BA3
MTNTDKPVPRQPAKAPQGARHTGGTKDSAASSMFDPVLVRPAIVDSFRKLTPRTQFRNPVMFCVYVGSILTTILW